LRLTATLGKAKTSNDAALSIVDHAGQRVDARSRPAGAGALNEMRISWLSDSIR